MTISIGPNLWPFIRRLFASNRDVGRVMVLSPEIRVDRWAERDELPPVDPDEYATFDEARKRGFKAVRKYVEQRGRRSH